MRKRAADVWLSSEDARAIAVRGIELRRRRPERIARLDGPRIAYLNFIGGLMSLITIVLIVVVAILLLGGGGYYWRR